MTEIENAILTQLQKGLPIVSRPFKELAEQTGCTEQEALDIVKRSTSDGTIRKFGGFINHYAAGFEANGMVVWDVDEERLVDIGNQFAKYKNVSHCYARPKSDKWPYRLYTMIHCRTKEEVEDSVKKMSGLEGISNYKILFSVREYKKINRWLG